jgi:hypothetical protein
LRQIAGFGDDGATTAGNARVVTGDIADLDVAECAAWHIDPDRRPAGRRTTRVSLHEPGVEVMERLLARNETAAIKLAPAAELPPDWPERAELEWIGHDRQCRQLVAWFSGLSTAAGQRRATMLRAGATAPRTIVGAPGDEPAAIGTVHRFLYEPDAAVLAAGLGPTLAAEHGAARVTAGIAYWTGDVPLADDALACFEVHEVLPLDLKRLKGLLRARGVGRLEIKKRGVEVSPEQLRAKLKPSGDAEATLIVTRVRNRVTAIVAQRVVTDLSYGKAGG